MKKPQSKKKNKRKKVTGIQQQNNDALTQNPADAAVAYASDKNQEDSLSEADLLFRIKMGFKFDL